MIRVWALAGALSALAISGGVAQEAPTLAPAFALRNPDPHPGDRFGGKVAISLQVAAVAATGDNPGGKPTAGSVHLFSPATGTQLARLDDPSPADYDSFGAGLAVSGAVVAVGCPGEKGAAFKRQGAVYIYQGPTFAPKMRLDDPMPQENGGFGIEVAMTEKHIIVGAVMSDTVYVFDAATGALKASIKDPTPGRSSRFGDFLGASGGAFLTGDNAAEINGLVNVGSAYICNAATGAIWKTLTPPTVEKSALFGSAVAISGKTAVVGRQSATIGKLYRAGIAHVFDAETGALTRTIENPAPKESDAFGGALAADGPYVAIGAHQKAGEENQGGPGVAYLFDAATGAIAANIPHPDPKPGDTFGGAVALGGGFCIVGAPGKNLMNAASGGGAWIFKLPGR